MLYPRCPVRQTTQPSTSPMTKAYSPWTRFMCSTPNSSACTALAAQKRAVGTEGSSGSGAPVSRRHERSRQRGA